MGEPKVILRWGDADYVSIALARFADPRLVLYFSSAAYPAFSLFLSRGEARVLIDALEREVSASYEPAFADRMVRDE